MWRHMLRPRKNIKARYGEKSYAVIIGPLSGQGEVLAHELANQGFNILVISNNDEEMKRVKKDFDIYHKEIKI